MAEPSPPPPPPDDLRVLVLATTGRDAALAQSVLTRGALASKVCADINDLCAGVRAGAGAALLAEEVLNGDAVRALIALIDEQPPWSDFPLVVMTSDGDLTHAHPGALRSLGNRANVALLERPVRMMTLVSAVQAALRARRRQYEVRDLLARTEKAVRDRDAFLAMLGHELRNPLATIRNAVEVLGRAGAPHDAAEQRDTIARQTSLLSRLINDLLDVSRITAGKIALRRDRMDLAEVVRRVVNASAQAARDDDHELIFKADPTRPVIVNGDAERLEQVAENLLTNAIKYTPRGGRIWVELSQDPASGEAVLTVRDTGIGMPADLLPRIFDLFAQADQSLDRSRGGMGIGLTIVQRIVEMLGGQVSGRSAGLGQGSEFEVRLPLAAPLPSERPATTHPSPGAPPEHPRRILIIEDNDDGRRILKRLLQLQGHVVETAHDGVEGLQRALSLRPEIALVDIGLPGIDGYEVARRVRAELGNDTFLVAITGYGQPDDRARALAAGFDLHLVKPVDPQNLFNVLSHGCDGRPRQLSPV